MFTAKFRTDQATPPAAAPIRMCLPTSGSRQRPSSRRVQETISSGQCRRTLVDCNSLGAQAIELGVSLYGADRIMFGTDGSAFGAEWSMRAVAEARIEEWEKRAILDGTAVALLSACAP